MGGIQQGVSKMDNVPNDGVAELEQPKDRAQLVTNWLLGAVIVLLIAIVAFVVLRDDPATVAGDTTTTTTVAPGVTETTEIGETTTVPGDITETTLATSTTVSDSTTTIPVDTTQAPTPDETIASSLASEWITALGDGDADTAWELLDPASQAAIGGRSGFDGSFTGLVEGYGAWADATDVVVYTSPVPLVEPAELYIVSWAGTVNQEGVTSPSAIAIPVTVNQQGAFVNPFLRGDLVEFVVPERSDPPAIFANITTFEVDIPTDAVPLVFVNGFYETNQQVQDLGGGKSRVYITPDGNLEVGANQVLAVVYFFDGLVHAEAVNFVIGEDS